MEMFSIASGSSGNCICIGTANHHILIDAGVSKKRIENGLQQMDLSLADMEAIFVTHEHSDHVSGLGVVARKYGIPIYATSGTLHEIWENKTLGTIDTGLFHEISVETPKLVGDLIIDPMEISHDAAEPVAYIVSDNVHRVAVVTDMGCFSQQQIQKLQGLDALLIEANHDIHMLQVGSYPYYLKQRILGDHGHLSNEACGQLLGQLLHDNMKHVLLGHLSKENNYEQLAYETVRLEVTLGDNPYRGSDFPITVAPRDQNSLRIEL